MDNADIEESDSEISVLEIQDQKMKIGLCEQCKKDSSEQLYQCEDCYKYKCHNCVEDDAWEERLKDEVFLCTECWKINARFIEVG